MLIEVLAAILVLSVGIVGLLTGFTFSQKLSLSSEKLGSISQVAQREIERVEGLPYATVALTSTPTASTDPANPDYYVVSGSQPAYEWNRTSATEALDVDSTNGTVVPVQSWTEGTLSGAMYDFVTWTTDPKCGSLCPASQDYKRITVAVTVSGTHSPSPVYVSSVITDPNAAPAKGTANGTSGNPIASAGTTCATSTGTTTTQGSCESPIDSGTPNTLFMHDCSANASSCGAPTSGPLHDTVGAISGLTGQGCSTTLKTLSGVASNLIGACPTPDTLDTNPPTGSTTPVTFDTDQKQTGYVGGRLLQPLCATTSGCGSGSPSDCNSAASWASNLSNTQNELWATAPLSTNTTLTGEGALNLFTQTQNGTSALVTLCVELYEIPPSGGIAGSLADLLAWPPTPLGGAGYVAAANPSTGANWPTAPTNVNYEFNFASGGVTVPAGDRIGVRIWMVANVNAAIALLYDNPSYPTELQLNSQSGLQFSS